MTDIDRLLHAHRLLTEAQAALDEVAAFWLKTFGGGRADQNRERIAYAARIVAEAELLVHEAGCALDPVWPEPLLPTTPAGIQGLDAGWAHGRRLRVHAARVRVEHHLGRLGVTTGFTPAGPEPGLSPAVKNPLEVAVLFLVIVGVVRIVYELVA